MLKVNRRDFLKKTAASSAAAIGFPYIIPSSALGKAGTVAPSNRITMGCIGLGGQGTFNMLAFAAQKDVQILALCDVNHGSDKYDMLYQFPDESSAGLMPAVKKLKTFYKIQTNTPTFTGCDTYHDFRRLLERDDIDAVTVCTPDHWHGLISIAAAKAGKDIYCEKPLTNTVAVGRAVCDAVNRYGRILQTGSHERSNNSTRFAAELIMNGLIGKVHTIRINMPTSDGHQDTLRSFDDHQPTMPVPQGFDYDFWLGPAPQVPYTQRRCHFWWRYIMAHGGGEMTDRGAHIIDLAQMCMDYDNTGPVEISGIGRRINNGLFDTFLEYEFECKYADGVRMIGSSKGQRGLKFEGTDGWIFIHVHGGRLEAEPLSLLEQKIGHDRIRIGRSPGHHRNFLDSVRNRSNPVAHAQIGHRTATICHLVNIAFITGQKLKWDPVTEKITNHPVANKMLSRPMRNPWRI